MLALTSLASFEVRALEIGDDPRARQIGAGKARPDQLGLDHAGLTQIGALEIGLDHPGEIEGGAV